MRDKACGLEFAFEYSLQTCFLKVRFFLTADLVTFTEEIFNGKLHFLFSESTSKLLDSIVELSRLKL